MRKPVLGAVLGAVLGVLDGASAWAYPEARPMIGAIIVSSVLKGLLTGLAAGFVARRWTSTVVGVVVGVAIGFVLSSAAALAPGAGADHYFDIVLPGMLLGGIVGYVTERYPRGTKASLISGLVALCLAPLLHGAQQPAPVDPFEPLAFLVGTWEGTSTGQPGQGTVRRTYARVLGDRFIRVDNRSTYPPQEKNPKGEVHEDVGFISFDKARRQFILRQFHIEGFVNQYAGTRDASGRIVFASEAIENIPPGWRARETYVVTAPDALEEIFELAEPGKDFSVYVRLNLRRVVSR